jgi:cob(I)alamin adenosyltransferase
MKSFTLKYFWSEGELNECTRVPSHRAKTRSRERIKVKLSTEPREQKPSEP